MKSAVAILQPLGRALMLPIAVLPIAGLLLRFGQPDMVELGLLSASAAALLAAAGGAIFDQLGLLFAVGVALGFARDSNGTACLAGVVCYLVAAKGAATFLIVPSEIGAGLAPETQGIVEEAWRAAAVHKFDVPLGIVAGLVGGNFYNRFSQISLPEYLAFFGGRRFVPIASGLAGLAIAFALGLGHGALNYVMDGLSEAMAASGSAGLFLFGLLNRLLIVTGLHHILNNVIYFMVGEWHGTTGDLRRFFAGDPDAGAFMSGFFPVMMFGLPAACLAMYQEVPPERRKAMGGMFFSLALTSILTGVTEPIEFSFMFVAPLLYAIHAVLTGVAAVVMNLFEVRLGFSFSAGLIDYALNYTKAGNPVLLLPIGLGYALVYYGVFRFAIRRWNLATPGRERAEEASAPHAPATDRGAAFVAALGGAGNLRSVSACTTRLRLLVHDHERVDEPALRRLGARGVVKPSAEAVQVILGPIADAVAMDMQRALGEQTPEGSAASAESEDQTEIPGEIIAAVGGRDNVLSAAYYPGRWRLEIEDEKPVSADLLLAAGARSFSCPGPGVLHILVGGAVDQT